MSSKLIVIILSYTVSKFPYFLRHSVYDHTCVLVVFQWSFGVTLWELMTLAHQPYADVDPFEMVTYLLHGYRMCQPVHCPNELYVVTF